MKKLIMVFCILFSSLSLAQTAPVKINQVMKNLGKTMEELFPYLFNEQKFNDVKNETLIKEKIKDLNTYFAQAESHFKDKGATYSIPYTTLKDHFQRTTHVFNSKNKDFSRSMLKASTEVCMSCHSQDHKTRLIFSDLGRDFFASDFEYAEFNFMTRNYKRAVKYYDDFLKRDDLETYYKETVSALKRKMTIHLQIEQKIDEAQKDLKMSLDNKKLSRFIKSEVIEWLEGLDELEKEKIVNKQFANIKELEPIIIKYLGEVEKQVAPINASGKEEVFHLALMGKLFDLIGKATKEEIPQILYYLAITDKALNFSFFYSFGDLYLKECVTSYAKNPFALKCYNQYREIMIHSFTGSRGTDLPADVQKELDDMKKSLKIK